MSLSESQIQRYSRHILLPDIGGTGQMRLLAASAEVAVSDGCGATVAALAYLAAAGVGTLVVVGPDARRPVTANDVRSGILYAYGDIGRPRLDALRDRLIAINPDVEVTDSGSGTAIDIERQNDVAGALISGGQAALQFVAEVAR